jgi:hypothetical protein
MTRLQWLATVTGLADAILIIRPTGGDTAARLFRDSWP